MYASEGRCLTDSSLRSFQPARPLSPNLYRERGTNDLPDVLCAALAKQRILGLRTHLFDLYLKEPHLCISAHNCHEITDLGA